MNRNNTTEKKIIKKSLQKTDRESKMKLFEFLKLLMQWKLTGKMLVCRKWIAGIFTIWNKTFKIELKKLWKIH